MAKPPSSPLQSIFGALKASQDLVSRGAELCVTVRDRALQVADGADRVERGLREAGRGVRAALGEPYAAPVRLEVIEVKTNPPKTRRGKK